MEKLERLLNLTVALLEARRPLTTDELQQRVPGYPDDRAAYRRAFERDKEDLREMGVPVRLLEIEGSYPLARGYRIFRVDYELSDPGLDADELAALHLAANAVRLDGGPEAMWKLGGIADPVPASGEPPGDAEVATPLTDPNLVELFAGVIDRRTARFGYRATEREIDPYRLDFARGRWYLSGYDHIRGEERNYRLDRIDGAVTLGEPGGFERPARDGPGLELAPWQLGEGEPQVARVRIDADQAPSAQHQVGTAAAVVEEGEDGSVVIELAVTNPAGFRSFVLGFLDHAEVLDPPELRADVVAWLTACARS